MTTAVGFIMLAIIVILLLTNKTSISKGFIRMFFRFRIMRYGIGYAIPHFLSRE